MSAIKKICAGALALTIMCAGAVATPRYNTREAEINTFEKKSVFGSSVIYRSSQSVAVYTGGATMGEMLTEAGAMVAAGDTVATYYAPMNDVDIARTEMALAQAQDDYEYEMAQRSRIIAEYREAAANADNETDARINELMAQKEELLLTQYDAAAQAEIAGLTAQRDAAITSHEPKPVNVGIDGMVAFASRTDSGANITGRELVSVFTPDSMIIRVDNSSGALKYGMKVELTLEGNGKAVVAATVISADNVLPGALQSKVAYVLPDEMPTGAGYNRASVYAKTISVDDVVVVNNNTIQYANSKPYVRILTDDGIVRTRYVNIAMLGDSESWIILGVEPGDKLITK